MGIEGVSEYRSSEGRAFTPVLGFLLTDSLNVHQIDMSCSLLITP
jgi:hypothetical protein